MTSRLERLASALAALECDAYVSTSPADLRYFAGLDEDGVLLVRPGRPIQVLTRASAHAYCEAAGRAEIRSYTMVDGPDAALVRLIEDARCGRFVAEGLSAAQQALLQVELPALAFRPAAGLSARLRRRKDEDELRLLRRAAEIVDTAMNAAMGAIGAGVSELEVAAIFESTARRNGATGPIGATQVKSGLRGAYADAAAGDHPIERDSVGYVDVAIRVEGYLGDMTRAFVVGDLPDDARRILETVDRVQRTVRDLVKPGAAGRALDAEARRLCSEAGFPGNPPHHTGHAMGLGDDLPRLVPTSEDVLEEGDVVTVEPGVYVAGVGGVRIEDVLLVTREGAEVLSRAPRITSVG